MERPLSSFKLKDAAFQILAACVAHSLAVHAGINMAFSTIVIQKIFIPGNFSSISNVEENDTTILDSLQVDKEEATWFASIVTIFTPVGSIVSGVLMDRWGRKSTCLLSAIVLVSAWCATALTSSQVHVLYLARGLAGVGAGLCTAALVYVSEISHASVRPMLLSLNSAFVSFGILLTSVIGTCLPWRGVGIFNGILAFSTFVIIFFIPESPIWLVRNHNLNEQQRQKKVLKSLRWFYRKQELCEKEYATLLKSENKDEEQCEEGTEVQAPIFGHNGTTFELGAPESDENLKKPSIWKPISLLCMLFLLQQLSGSYIMIIYAIQIFQKAGSVQIDEMTSLIGLGVIRFLMAIVSAFLSKSFGRRFLLGVSGVGMTVSMLVAFLWLTFATPSIVPILCILCFVCFSSFGYMVIPWTLIGELLPNNIRGKGSGLMISYAYLLMFITVKLFLYVMDAIGPAYLFLVFAIFSAMSVAYVHFYIPETLGKTFEEIAKNF